MDIDLFAYTGSGEEEEVIVACHSQQPGEQSVFLVTKEVYDQAKAEAVVDEERDL